MSAIRSPQRVARDQQGATLVVVLIMLVVLTLFAVAVINLSNLNAKAVGNMQQRKNAEIVAQGAIEQVLSSSAPFYSPAAAVAVTVPTGMAVNVSNRVCTGSAAATGYSLAQQLVPEDDYWDFQVSVTDNVTGASAVVHQGIKIRMLAGNCPL
jgi:Tfp pilus assembly protein PilX